MACFGESSVGYNYRGLEIVDRIQKPGYYDTYTTVNRTPICETNGHVATAQLLLVFHHHSLFHSRLKTFLFCKSFPLQPFLFFFRTDYR